MSNKDTNKPQTLAQRNAARMQNTAIVFNGNLKPGNGGRLPSTLKTCDLSQTLAFFQSADGAQYVKAVRAFGEQKDMTKNETGVSNSTLCFVSGILGFCKEHRASICLSGNNARTFAGKTKGNGGASFGFVSMQIDTAKLSDKDIDELHNDGYCGVKKNDGAGCILIDKLLV